MAVNEFGQPVGEAVTGWTPRPAVGPVELLGRHVVTQPLSQEHVPALHRALVLESPETIWSYYPDVDRSSPSAFSSYVDQLCTLPAAQPLALLRPTGEALGVACFLRIDPPNGSVEVGNIVYAAAMQRTIAATEAMVLMMRHAFDVLGYRRYEWKCDSLNEPSRRAAARLGFTYEGTFRNAMVYRGRNRDTAWFSITDAEWPACSAAYDEWLTLENFDSTGRQVRSLSQIMGRVAD